MRLGGFYAADSAADLDALCERLDRHGLSAISAPGRLADMPDEECDAFGERARELGLVIGEAGMWDSLMTPDPALQTERIERIRTLLSKANLMGCRCVVSLVGSPDPSDLPLAPHPVLFTKEGAGRFREIVLRILDGLELTRTRYAIEPWRTSFFFEPEGIAEFIASVDHPRFALHLDLVNMVDRRDYVDTAGLAERTFALLSDRIVGAHLKDLRWDPEYMALRWDEVLVGDGVMDYPAYLRGLAALDPDLPCFCEHLPTEADYAENFARLRRIAAAEGLRFLPRDPYEGAPR
ncbi:MAG TPA: TIM barrel protein [Actinomycetota bacterium]|nr:TIM barrel protein [Actinomycetota bacterium]